MGHSVNILIYRALWSMEICLLDSSLKLVLCRLHQWRMECSTYFQGQGTLCSCSLKLLTSLIYCIDVTTDYQLSRTIEVSRYTYIAILVYLCTNFFHFLVWKTNDGSHRRRRSLTCFLHGHGTGVNQLQSILKTQCACCDKC